MRGETAKKLYLIPKLFRNGIHVDPVDILYSYVLTKLAVEHTHPSTGVLLYILFD